MTISHLAIQLSYEKKEPEKQRLRITTSNFYAHAIKTTLHSYLVNDTHTKQNNRVQRNTSSVYYSNQWHISYYKTDSYIRFFPINFLSSPMLSLSLSFYSLLFVSLTFYLFCRFVIAMSSNIAPLEQKFPTISIIFSISSIPFCVHICISLLFYDHYLNTL